MKLKYFATLKLKVFFQSHRVSARANIPRCSPLWPAAGLPPLWRWLPSPSGELLMLSRERVKMICNIPGGDKLVAPTYKRVRFKQVKDKRCIIKISFPIFSVCTRSHSPAQVISLQSVSDMDRSEHFICLSLIIIFDDQLKVLRFYGNLCCHFTVPNVSSVTRVSFDTRVLSLAHHDPDWSDRLGRPCLFRVGQYYKVPTPSWQYKVHYTFDFIGFFKKFKSSYYLFFSNR